MEPIDTHSPQPPRASASRQRVILAIAIALTVVICGCPGLMVLGIVFGRPGGPLTIVWYYEDMRFKGSKTEACEMHFEAVLPKDIAIQIRDGAPIDLSTLTWKTINMMAEQGTAKDWGSLPEEGKVNFLIGDIHQRCTVRFQDKQLKSIVVTAHVKINRTSTRQDITLPANWSDVEKVFGKPKKKGRL